MPVGESPDAETTSRRSAAKSRRQDDHKPTNVNIELIVIGKTDSKEIESLLADPRIFVLDEATSSVDTVTEQLIQNAIEKVMTGRTSFIIAHRLSTIRRADVILVVHDGKIIESGTHRSLMSAHGPYYRLYTRQYREEQTKSMMD